MTRSKRTVPVIAIVMAAITAAALAGCGGGTPVAGTYVNEQRMEALTLTPDGEAFRSSRMGEDTAGSYKVEGEKVVVTSTGTGEELFFFMIQGEDLVSPEGFTYVRKG